MAVPGGVRAVGVSVAVEPAGRPEVTLRATEAANPLRGLSVIE
jgi:hypothetical protein